MLLLTCISGGRIYYLLLLMIVAVETSVAITSDLSTMPIDDMSIGMFFVSGGAARWRPWVTYECATSPLPPYLRHKLRPC